jgi:steroid 5-alpha reductase family enzyme
MSFLQTYALAAGGVLIYMLVLWLASLWLRNSSIVDIFWGFGFVVTGWLYYALTVSGFEQRKLLLMVLVTVWGLRLSGHILRRNWGKPEDYRYQQWRQESGGSWWWYSFFKVFLLQGALLWLISAPLLAGQISPQPATLTFWDYLAVALWLVGFFFEAVGDWQLANFKANPANKGKVMDRGLWRYSRHPNYFGESVQWWAYYLLALAAGGWWTIFSPVVMTTLLLRVSGVALLEKGLRQTKPAYAEYIANTSAFIPWFPKGRSSV